MESRTRPGLFARIRSFIRRRPLASGFGAAAVLGVGLYLFFGFFAFHLVFVDSEVDEANPFATAAVTTEAPVPTTAPAERTDSEAATTTTTTVVSAEPTIEVLGSGEFISRGRYETMGTASVITDGDRTFLRLEGFETNNGPDLNVYLATGSAEGDIGDYIDLGDLKGNIGDQNYELDASIEISTYHTVYIWCVRFSVPFGAAELS